MVNHVSEKPEKGSDWKKDSELTVVGKRIQILFQTNKLLKTFKIWVEESCGFYWF